MKKISTIKDDSRKILSKSDRAEILIERASSIELKEFIIDAIQNDDNLMNYFITFFFNYDNNESLKEYENQVKALKKKHFSTARYLDEYKVEAFNKDINLMVKTAERHIENYHYNSAFMISAAILKVGIEIYKAHQYADLKQCLDTPMELILEISKFEISEELRKQIVDFCTKSLKSNSFIIFNWQNDIFELALELCQNRKESNAIIDAIDSNKKDLREFQLFQIYKYKAISHFLGKDEADSYFEENIKNPWLRKILTEDALEKRDFEFVNKMIELGLNYDKNDQSFMILWHNLQFQICRLNEGDKNAIKSARYLLMHSK